MGLPGLYETILETSGPELCQALKACPSRLDECSDHQHMQLVCNLSHGPALRWRLEPPAAANSMHQTESPGA